jgi:hypothetical protein
MGLGDQNKKESYRHIKKSKLSFALGKVLPTMLLRY